MFRTSGRRRSTPQAGAWRRSGGHLPARRNRGRLPQEDNHRLRRSGASEHKPESRTFLSAAGGPPTPAPRLLRGSAGHGQYHVPELWGPPRSSIGRRCPESKDGDRNKQSQVPGPHRDTPERHTRWPLLYLGMCSIALRRSLPPLG
jgi:hypothetical protein